MDDPAVDRAALDGALRAIRWVNRRVGGQAALLTHLARWSARWDKAGPITLLDIATGSADLPIAARRWALDRGFDLRITAVDLHATTLDLAREHVARQEQAIRAGITLERADALALDDRFAPGAFDYTHAGLFLHHLTDDHAAAVLRSMRRLARRGLVWNDLHRSRVGYAATWLATLFAGRIVRHDARVSVLAGFTRDEALALARRAGIDQPRYDLKYTAHRFTVTWSNDDPSKRSA